MVLMKKCLVELIGTFFLVFTVGSMVLLTGDGAIPAIAIGFALMIMVYAGGHISGGHYNPAVSLAAAIRKAMPWKDIIPYWISQLVGAAAASAIIVSQIDELVIEDCPYTTAQLAIGEILFTFALCYVVLLVATSKKTEGNSFYGLAIGATVTVGAFAGGAFCYGAYNPAVAAGLGIMSITGWTVIAKTIVFDLLGAVAAALVYKLVNNDEE